MSVHQQHVVTLCIGGIDVAVLVVLVVGVEVDEVAILVCLFALDEGLVLLLGVELALRVLQQSERLGLVVEVALAEHAVVDENLDVIPLFLELLAVAFENGGKPVAHLFRDVGGNLLHVRVALQIAAAHVQRNVGRVDHAMQECHKVRDDALHIVGHKHLIAVQVDFVLLDVEV